MVDFANSNSKAGVQDCAEVCGVAGKDFKITKKRGGSCRRPARLRLWQLLKPIPLPRKILQRSGQCEPQVALGFQAIVHDDDGAGLRIVEHMAEALFWGNIGVVVAAQNVP